MALSSDLISQFVKTTKDEEKKKETTVYGTITEYDGKRYVKLDGSELLTPISTTADALDGERVTVMIQNHTAIVTGNLSSPAARTESVKEIGSKVTEFEIIIADKVSVDRLETEIARINTLVSDNVTIRGRLDANEADIGTLTADNATIYKKLTAAEAEIESLETKKIDAEVAEITYATVGSLSATQADIHDLRATYGEFTDLTTEKLTAAEADINDLTANKLSASEAALKYANVDFANINMAAIEKLFTQSGIIKDLTVSEGKITGELVGVTIRGDRIEGNTIVADKLVVKGEDGLYYKLNTDGVTTEAEQTDYNSLNGTVIRAKSITAEKIAVDDLVAFDATIGGFKITDSAIYSGVKESVENTTRGVYLDSSGQMAFGDAQNFLRYYKDQNGNYKLAISANELTFGSSSSTIEQVVGEAVDEIQKDIQSQISETIKDFNIEFYLSTSVTELNGGEWLTTAPEWTDGMYMWMRIIRFRADGASETSDPTCIAGATGLDGIDGKDGLPGPKGEDGKSSYAHIAYADNATGTSGFSTSDSVNKLYMGMYVDDTPADSTDPSKYSWTKIKGDKGDSGVSITNSVAQYYLSTSSTAQTGGSWVTTPPAWVDGRYYWQRIVTTLSDGSTKTSNPVCVTGGKGGTGATGKGVSAIVTEFYLSDSKTSQTGGSWVASMPIWSAGKYLWTRNKITYTDNTSTTTAPVCDSSWDAVNDLQDYVNGAITRVETATTKALQDANSYTINALKNYVTNTAWDTFVTEVNAQLSVQANNITSSFSSATTQTVEVNGKLQDFISQVSAMIRQGMDASGSVYIELGESSSAFKTKLTTTRLSFTQGDREIAYISNNRLYITDVEITGSLTIGSKYKTYVDTNGLLVTQLI